MWDVATGSVLGRSWFPDLGPQDNVAAAFSADGRSLFIVSASGEAWVWDMDSGLMGGASLPNRRKALTEAEWQVNLPDRPYDPTCTA